MEPNSSVVSVFKTSDPAVLPLATMALETAGIEYFVKHAGKSDSLQWMMSQDPTTRPIAVEILVGSHAEKQARDVLAGLENPTAIPADPLPDGTSVPEPPTVTLEDARNGALIGAITEWQLQELTSRLEEDGEQQYFVDGSTVDMLQAAGADSELVELLRRAVRSAGSGLPIRWIVR